VKLFKKSAICLAALGALAGPVFAQQVIIGTGNNTPGAYTITIGNNNTNSGPYGFGYFIGSGNNSTGNNVAIGDNNTLTGNTGSTGIGFPTYVVGSGNNVGADAANVHGSNNNISATADSANVMGDGNTVSGVGSVTIGTGSTNSGQGSSAIGNGVSMTGANSVALGGSTVVSGSNAGAIGSSAQASADGAYAIGTGAVASQAGSVALGSGSTTGVAIGTTGVTLLGQSYSFAGTTPASTVSVGAAGSERTVTNVAAGRLTASSTDGVNGSQLYATNSALGALADRSVQYDLNADGTVNHSNVTMAGPASTDGGVTGGTSITNIHQGAITGTSTDAVNGAQIYNIAGDTSNTYVTQNGRGVRYVRTNDTGLPLADAHALGQGSSALGYNATSSGQSSLAMGNNATASGQDAIASGTGAAASGTGSIAMGAGATAAQNGAVALGSGSTTSNGVDVAGVTLAGNAYTFAGANGSAQGTVSVGAVGAERQVQNVAAGQLSATSTDAINGSQLFATNTALGKLADRSVQYDLNSDGTVNYGNVTMAGPASTDGGVTGGTTITNVHQGAVNATSTDAVNGAQIYNIAGDTSTSYVNQNGRGVRYVRTNDSGLSLSDSSAQGVGSSAMGYNAVATGDAALAMGFNSNASGQNSIAAGTGSTSSGTGSIALGAGSTAKQNGAVALGAGSTTSNGVDVGGAIIAGSAYSFAGAKGSAQGTVSVGAVGAERQVQNVAAGQLSATSTDAVNGSQLFATNKAIDSVNAHVNVLDGRVTVIEADVNNLYQITGNLDARTTVLEDTAVRYDVRQDGSVNYNSITLGGAKGNGPTAIHNLADGVANNDAVNKGQLDAAKKQLGAGVAVGVAMSGLTQANEPDRTMVTAATGVYGSDLGVAAGVSRMFDNGRVVVKGGVGFSATKGAKVGIAVGAGMNL
jgi:autotransporter adhesin